MSTFSRCQGVLEIRGSKAESRISQVPLLLLSQEVHRLALKADRDEIV